MAAIVDLSGATLQRSIVTPSKTFESYVTLEEDHADDSVITEHPVEVGAIMSDHIYQRPPTVKLHLGWSNADDVAGGDAGYAKGVYVDLLAMKTNRQLFKVYTGKRLYNNMFIASLRVHTDAKFEYALVAECEMKQLLLVSTQTSGGGSTATTAGASASPAANATPGTVPTTDTGNVQTIPGSFSSSESPSLNLQGSGPGGFQTLPSVPSAVFTGGGSVSDVGSTPAAEPIAAPNSNDGGAGPIDTFSGPF